MTMMIFVPDFDKPNNVFEVDIVKSDEFYSYGTEKGKVYAKSNIFPLSAKHEVIDICNKRYELKKAYDDSDKLIYQLHNKVSNGEYR